MLLIIASPPLLGSERVGTKLLFCPPLAIVSQAKDWKSRMAAKKRQKALKAALLFAVVTLGVFGAGMIATNPTSLHFATAAIADAPNGADTCRFIKVHDGDTIRCGIERVRLLDIDAPELATSPKCEGWRRERSWCDEELAHRSRNALRDFLAQGPVDLRRQGKDRYGRTLAVVEVNGQSAGQYLIGLGLARAWQ